MPWSFPVDPVDWQGRPADGCSNRTSSGYDSRADWRRWRAAARIAARLIEHGLDPATPVAVIENGTLPNQRAVYGRLSGLGWLVRQSGIAGPALIVIGRVAALADTASPALDSAPARAVAV